MTSAVDLLVKAFDGDPYFCWLVPEQAKKEALIEGVMRSNSELAFPRGAFAGITSPSLRGVCLYYPPGSYPVPVADVVRTRGAAILGAYRKGQGDRRVIGRALRMGDLLDDALPERGDFYYLQVLAVDPSVQGRGLGSSMLETCTQAADRDRLPAYLETSKPLNVRLYRRHGFEIVRTTRLDSSPPIWTMRRDPPPIS